MMVTRVHLLNDPKGQVVWMGTTEGDIDDAMPISETMARCLTVDIQNQIANGRGAVHPTPWGWFWTLNYGLGTLVVPPKLYYAHYPYGHPSALYTPLAYPQSERR